MSKTAGSGGATSKLLDALGIDAKSYDCFVAWCLAEELVSELTRVVNEDGAHQTEALWRRADGLKRFRSLVRRYTRRNLECE